MASRINSKPTNYPQLERETAVSIRPTGGIKAFAPHIPHSGSLAGELWPDQQPAMVAIFSHFAGQYPNPDHEKTCRTRWVLSGRGRTAESFGPVNYRQWRDGVTQKGQYILACPHCRHEHVTEKCKDIEAASEHYAVTNPMLWAKMTDEEAKRAGAMLRKRRERGDNVNYATFPLQNEKTILLHDAADVGGQALPTDRGELYDLVGAWALNTPKGNKRAGRGLAAWGEGAKVETAGETREHKLEKYKQETIETLVRTTGAWIEDNLPEEDKHKVDAIKDATTKKEVDAIFKPEQPKRWRIIGTEYLKVSNLIAGYLGETPTSRGLKMKVDVGEILKRLDQVGIDYAIEGDLPEDVTLNVCKPKDTYVKRDTPQNEEGIGKEKPGNSASQAAFDGLTGGEKWR